MIRWSPIHSYVIHVMNKFENIEKGAIIMIKRYVCLCVCILVTGPCSCTPFWVYLGGTMICIKIRSLNVMNLMSPISQSHVHVSHLC